MAGDKWGSVTPPIIIDRPMAMERMEESAEIKPHGENVIVGTQARPLRSFASMAMGEIDRKSAIGAVFSAISFSAIGFFSLILTQSGSSMASIWLANGFAVAVLLLARLRNEALAFAGFGIASFAANALVGKSLDVSAIYGLASLISIAAVTILTRRACGERPDMTDLSHVARFLIIGGFVGPGFSALVVSLGAALNGGAVAQAMSAWFLGDSMGILLAIPAALLIAQANAAQGRISADDWREGLLLMLGSLLGVLLVFQQEIYPLLFVVPPITMLVAFRIGALGVALFVPAIALIANWSTYMGLGPIVANSTSEISTMYLIQAFVAANFLSGLPIAAILAARERMTTKLADQNWELNLLARNVTDAVLKLDGNGVCTYASPSVRTVMAREPDSFVGFKIAEQTHEDANERIASTLERLQNGEVERERVTYRRLRDAEDGTPVFLEADCALAFDPDTGRRSGIVISCRDVTERVELELLLTRARRHAENAARAKSQFLANMSHEIRTPMNGVLGFAELMLQGELDDENRRHTELIVQSGRSMMLLLNDILDHSKIEAGQITIDEAPVDLTSTINECVQVHRPNAERKGLELRFAALDCDGESYDEQANENSPPPPWILTDGLRLRQIVLNLISNAVKFTEKGFVEIRYRIECDMLTIEVRDTGIGITPSRIEKIFSPFTQAESDTSRRFGGTGLGLTISQQLATLLGGQITVDSTQGEGSLFRLSLPARMAEPSENRPEPEGRSVASAPELPLPARILMAEDHDVNRLLGSEMLERCGQSVALAHDGNEAIAMVIDSIMRERPFDLVLMDIQMPGCDGYAAARAIRAEGIGPNLMPIIALTANAFPEDIAAARDAGMQAHLAKPLVFGDLARTLQRWLPTRIVESETPFLSDSNQDRPNLPEHREASTDTVDAKPKLPNSHRSQHLPFHSPALLKRWTARRSEAIEAVRDALESGAFRGSKTSYKQCDEVARMVHKLAGTAAIFGEPELGDQAAVLERALRQNLPEHVQEALAFELLSVADDPTGLPMSND